jgi:hypothetical protein
VWEHGAGQHPADRALTLLSACFDKPREDLALLGLARRDRLLLEVYAELFGDALPAFAECAECGERLEYTLSARELCAATADVPVDLSLKVGEITLRLRPPNSFDLGAASVCADVASARRLLATRCIVEGSVAAETLAEAVVDQISGRLAEADPQAEVLIDLDCARCHHGWQVAFEVERFLWMKVGAMARRLLREVHTLAHAYGWSERDILALSPVRRQFYLEAVG